jgi:hypothetical protein
VPLRQPCPPGPYSNGHARLIASWPLPVLAVTFVEISPDLPH